MRWTVIFIFYCIGLCSQEPDTLLMSLRTKLDSLESFEATIHLSVDIKHVNLPDKTARIRFKKGRKLDIESESFVMIPKKGLDFNLGELFRYPYIALRTGKENINGQDCEVFRIIPESDKSDFSIATLTIDPVGIRLIRSEISTKKNGQFSINYSYASVDDVLPAIVEVSLSVTDIRVPLRFIAKDVEVDQKKLQTEEQTGTIRILFEDYVIHWRN